jgi:5-dehydro-2-deoxygluconokinase
VQDPYCRGIVVLGLDAPEAEIIRAFALAKDAPLVKGFAVGRTIFAEVAREWLSGRMTDEAAVAAMAAKFHTLVSEWTSHVETARKTAR